MKKAFLDSSVLFAAVASPTGGSSKLFTMKNLQLTTSPTVLTEVERNVRKKLQSHNLERFFMLVSKIIITSQKPNDQLIKQAMKIIVAKDAVILQETKQAGLNFLVTLDRKHFLTDKVETFLKSQKVLTPKMLIQKLEPKSPKV